LIFILSFQTTVPFKTVKYATTYCRICLLVFFFFK